ncbi:hypothetical protein ACVIGB_003792 [Bradyrhizobium sp. USDA 4341]
MDRPQKAFDLLALAAGFAQRHGLSLNYPASAEKFLADAAPRLKAALADPTLLHSSRTERMFEATLLSPEVLPPVQDRRCWAGFTLSGGAMA